MNNPDHGDISSKTNFFEIMKLYSALYREDRDEWFELLHELGRDEGGVYFSRFDKPMIDISLHETFTPILAHGFEHETARRGLEVTDFFVCAHPALFERCHHYYDLLDTQTPIEYVILPSGELAHFEVIQVVPLKAPKTGCLIYAVEPVSYTHLTLPTKRIV